MAKDAKDVIKQAIDMGACEKSGGVTNWKTLCWLFYSPQGLEFCENNEFPSIELFRWMKENVSDYGVLIDAGKVRRSNDQNVAIIGDTKAELSYDDNTKVHKVVLMHGGEAFIVARNYSVVRLVNIGGCKVNISKDKTSVILQ